MNKVRKSLVSIVNITVQQFDIMLSDLLEIFSWTQKTHLEQV